MPSIRLHTLTALTVASGLLLQPAAGRAATAQDAAARQAYALLSQASDVLAATLSDCNGGTIMVIACPPRGKRSGMPCQEPVGTCEAVAALRSTKEAMAALEKSAHP